MIKSVIIVNIIKFLGTSYNSSSPNIKTQFSFILSLAMYVFATSPISTKLNPNFLI